MWDDIMWGAATTQQLNHASESTGGMGGTVRGRAAQSGEGHRSASLRWFALIPDGSGAESPGKEPMALRMSTSLRETGVGVGSGGMVGGGTWGCLASISFRTSEEAWATPSEDRAWMAFLYCPYSMARFARLPLAFRSCSRGSFLVFFHRQACTSVAVITSAHRSGIWSAFHILMRALTRFRVSRQ